MTENTTPMTKVDEARTTQQLTIKLRLRDKHAVELGRQARAVNYVWNYCNETSERAWRRDRRWLSGFDLGKLTAGTSKELSLHAHTIMRVCLDFAKARDRAKHAKLRWRGRKSLGWVPFNTGHVSFNGETMKFRGADFQPMHGNSKLVAGAKLGAGSFNQDARGRWYINCPIKVECAEATAGKAVGMDLGLTTLAVMSDGSCVNHPRFYRASEKALATAQRGRKGKRAKNVQAKVANRRKDFLHKASLALVKDASLIFVGDMSAKKMARTRMAKSALDAGWSSFKAMLSYKAIMHGGRMIEVKEHNTSRTCSCCGAIPLSSPKGMGALGIRARTCDDCGAVHDRDVNAAQNILRRGLATLAEGVSA